MITIKTSAPAAVLFLAATLGCVEQSDAAITGRSVPAPIYGVTLDDASNASGEAASLSQMAKVPTARVVFDPGTSAGYYLTQIQKLRPVSYIMGELIDSSAMCHFSVSVAGSRAAAFTGKLGSNVDIWEIGNEVNGSWLCSNVIGKIEAMFDVVYAAGGRTALTFFYEGEPSEPNNCIDRSGGGNDMFTWIFQKFQAAPTAETEKIRLNVNYVLISWYPDQCPGENPNWATVFTKLAGIFPNSLVGFGELGTANPQGGSAFELNEINTIYPMKAGLNGLPDNYIGGVFWWYWAEEAVPSGTKIWNAINGAIQ